MNRDGHTSVQLTTPPMRSFKPILEWCVSSTPRGVSGCGDELFTMQVDGTEGSATVGLRKCIVQSRANTPTPVWNPDVESPIDFFEDWEEVQPQEEFDNAFKSQWELFLKHVVEEEPFPWTLREGAKGVQLAELSLQSSREGQWVEVPG